MNVFGKIAMKLVSSTSPDAYPLTKQQIDSYWDNGYLMIKKLYDLPTLNLFRERFIEICNEYESARRHVSVIKDPLLFDKNVKPEMFINKRVFRYPVRLEDDDSTQTSPTILQNDSPSRRIGHFTCVLYNEHPCGDVNATPPVFAILYYGTFTIQELLYDDVYMKYSEHPQMLDIVSQLIGDNNLTAVNCMLINKPPGTGRHPPHQDLYYFPFRPSNKIIAAWTAIDSVSIDNGCLYVIPGSHRNEVLYTHADQVTDLKQFYHGIVSEESAAPVNRRVQLIMEPGDTVFFHPYIVHGSGANNSQNYRKAMTAHYASSDCYYIDVKGTVHELIAKGMEGEIRRRGMNYSFVDIWRIKSKQVKGVRSNL